MSAFKISLEELPSLSFLPSSLCPSFADWKGTKNFHRLRNLGKIFHVLLLLLLLSRFSCVQLCVTPQRRQPTRPPGPWDSPGKNTGVGCHFLLQCRKVKSESEAAQSCPTLSNPMDCSLPGSSIHGIFQARALEWVPLLSPFHVISSPQRAFLDQIYQHHQEACQR